MSLAVVARQSAEAKGYGGRPAIATQTAYSAMAP